jgi:hypothetical protein
MSVDFPSQIGVHRPRQNAGAVRRVHCRMMFEAVAADKPHQLLQIRHCRRLLQTEIFPQNVLTDNGEPALTSYRRVILTIQGASR